MPIYTFRCDKGHETEDIASYNDRPNWIDCDWCEKIARLVPSRVSYVRVGGTPHTDLTADEFWRGSAFEGTDGNEGYLPNSTSNKNQVDLGHRNIPVRPHPVDHPKRRGIEFCGADTS